MSNSHYDSGPTSNDLLHILLAVHAQTLAREIAARNTDDAQHFDHAPSIRMNRTSSDQDC